jgi:Asp-tRNA(Asn)/Glu-tRNA(Gln) amidotransferase A subunit family amidase
LPAIAARLLARAAEDATNARTHRLDSPSRGTALFRSRLTFAALGTVRSFGTSIALRQTTASFPPNHLVEPIMQRFPIRLFAVVSFAVAAIAPLRADARGGGFKFQVEETTIEKIQFAIRTRQITSTDLITAYLERIKAYNGTCVNEPEGILGPISTIPDAGKINALTTLNLRPAKRVEWGFDDRKARSITDPVDDDPAMPDAFETAAALDLHFAKTGKLIGPLHGVVIALKDQYDTFDMRTTSGADAFWANDRPPDDATFVAKLRDAGAIILAKANMGEYAAGGITGQRSTFGGTMCNAYDTERDPGASSGGSGMAVAANFVTCAIGEETGTSVREPAKNNGSVGLAPTRELISADGMIQGGLAERVGPICRTVEDTARILDAYAGFDPADPLTAFSVGRKPEKPYWQYTRKKRLDGVRIGVVREYMGPYTEADAESLELVEAAIDDLESIGATIVDPGPVGLFQGCIDQFAPTWRNQQFISQFPSTFPVDATGAPTTDHVASLADMFFDTSLVPKTSTGQPDITGLGSGNLGLGLTDTGAGRFNFELYIRERGDAAITTLQELLDNQEYWNDPVIPARNLQGTADQKTVRNAATLQTRFALQITVLQCFSHYELDAVVYPTGSVPPAIITGPQEPTLRNRPSSVWTYVNSRGFPAMTVPAGFTTVVYDRAADGTLLPPIPAELPVGIDFLGRPFSEAKLFEIGAAYEAATKHRRPPPDFGPVTKTPASMFSARSAAPAAAKARPMPKPRKPTEDELLDIQRN